MTIHQLMFAITAKLADSCDETRQWLNEELLPIPCAFLMLPTELRLRTSQFVLGDNAICVCGKYLITSKQMPLLGREPLYQILLTYRSVYNKASLHGTHPLSGSKAITLALCSSRYPPASHIYLSLNASNFAMINSARSRSVCCHGSIR
jgi:hypothetical protein